MKIRARKLAGCFDIEGQPKADSRGHFMRWYDEALLESEGLRFHWVQANESLSRRNVVRGLHFQRPPHAEAKLVRAVAGAVFDVFVDLRRGSPTYGQWDAVELSARAHNAVLIPRGFAHGFCALTDDALVSYLVDNPYAPSAEGGLAWNDPRLGIPWPLSAEPVLSERDRGWPTLDLLEPL